jgi:hypothetical protein
MRHIVRRRDAPGSLPSAPAVVPRKPASASQAHPLTSVRALCVHPALEGWTLLPAEPCESLTCGGSGI